MKKISSDYVSGMLDKIQTNQTENEAEFEDTAVKKRKKKKSKKEPEPTADAPYDPQPQLTIVTQPEKVGKKKTKLESNQTPTIGPKDKKKGLDLPLDLNIK